MSVAACQCPGAEFPAWDVGELWPVAAAAVDSVRSPSGCCWPLLAERRHPPPPRCAWRGETWGTKATELATECAIHRAHVRRAAPTRSDYIRVLGQDMEATITRAATGTENKM